MRLAPRRGLTDRVEAEALALMAEVDRRGGSVAAIEAGFVQRRIHGSALAWQRSVESGDRKIVGVNDYLTEEDPPKIFRPDPQDRFAARS